MTDYLIVGLGLAGISFCEQLESNGKSFYVVADDSQQASLVAGGLYNPVILKRFTMAWKAHEQMGLVDDFYTKLESKLGTKLDYKVPVLRRFASIEEQNMWFEAADKPVLNKYLSTDLKVNHNPEINAPFGYGEVLYTGRIDTKLLQSKYQEFLEKNERFSKSSFDFESLEINEDSFRYQSRTYKKIVFADGFGLKSNPFFNYLPLNGTKGELLTIRAPKLTELNVIKSSVFIIPLGDDLYRIGATYKWKDKTNEPTEASKNELLEKLETFLKSDYEVVKHVAGVRPTVADRRPLLGEHPTQKSLYTLNGFGSRGVLIAPYASDYLYNFIEKGAQLPSEINIERFKSAYKKA
ncbi:NAD(P)/FAD-dependent oxidoreductase [Croceivirga thetidis]|uniref:FAD-dependent oxidoreductase n=1 Tax=Croceivirga thetidis TaxID=2721623 RepID=A0ABX1GS22_9FLAO|nr:FAD-dependent oxidoreductase [Croceivirga thetidis]NKI31725.1 FAD-dependent oxidoreductase [Croceivirga thetidis]